MINSKMPLMTMNPSKRLKLSRAYSRGPSARSCRARLAGGRGVLDRVDIPFGSFPQRLQLSGAVLKVYSSFGSCAPRRLDADSVTVNERRLLINLAGLRTPPLVSASGTRGP